MEHLNGQFQGSYKIMVYWSRLAVGFLIFKDGKFKQAPTCLGLLLTLDAFFWGGTCLDSFGILKTLKFSIYFP